LCEGDLTSRDDFHAGCHLQLEFNSPCDQVLQRIQQNLTPRDPRGIGDQYRGIWSNQGCLEVFRYTDSNSFAVHFDILKQDINLCKLQVSTISIEYIKFYH
jgi:hypothetical protein